MHLILDSYGISLVKKDDMFQVIHKDGKQEIATRQVRTISLSKGVRISSDAILMAIENQIDILFVNSMGFPQGRVWSQKYGSISNIRKNQAFFCRSPQAVDWIKNVLARKINNQMALISAIKVEDKMLEKLKSGVWSKLDSIRIKVDELEGDLIAQIDDTLRGYEGTASRQYFSCLSALLPTKYQFNRRSQHPAMDMFNCMLNYAYGMLYGIIEGALVRAGVDPYLGVFHRNEYNRPVLVYDFIEPYRVWAEQVVVNLCFQQVMETAFFSVNEKQAYWITSEGKRILIQCMNDYLDEVIGMNGKSRSRTVHIELDAQEFAQILKQSGPGQ